MKEMNYKILITGASTGIGKDIALTLAELGCRVYAGVRRKADKTELEKHSKNITGVYIDVTNSASIDKAFWFVLKNTEKLDVLINNAGIAIAGPIEILPVKKIKEQFDVNTFGAVAVTQKFLPLLHNGKVINISSMASYGIFPFIAPYCASKRAMDILFNSMLMETKRDIKIISIKPGVIATPLWDKSIDQNKASIRDCSGYEAEMEYMVKNAGKNGREGAPVQSVVDVVSEADSARKPKLTYTVGKDAFAARCVSKLPQSLINGIIKSKVKKLSPKKPEQSGGIN